MWERIRGSRGVLQWTYTARSLPLLSCQRARAHESHEGLVNSGYFETCISEAAWPSGHKSPVNGHMAVFTPRAE